MLTLSGVYSTDGISKTGVKIAIGALFDMVWKGSEGVPSNLSHDIHRFVGWTKITGLYVSHELSYVIGHTFIPENNSESEDLNKMRISFLKSQMFERINQYHSAFLKELNQFGVDCDKGKFFCNGLVMFGYPEIVDRTFPFLNGKKDKDGLIMLKDLFDAFDYKGQGVFASKTSNIAIMLHPYFRKSFSRYNNFNFEFLDELFKLFATNQTIKVRIDEDFVGYSPSYIKSVEFEYWFGPKYDDDISKIPIGVSCYKSSQVEKLYNQIDKTEFVWQDKDGKYQFEMEEVTDSDAPTLNTDQFACRYLHSIYDPAMSTFEHFDGAIRQYNLDAICDRITKPINQIGHNSRYTKLFRLDGDISLSTWKLLITNYLKNNYDIYRYFGMNVPQIQKERNETKGVRIENYVPYFINKGNGVRLYVSCHEKFECDTDFSFCSSDIMTTYDGKIEAVEFETINIAKAIRRMGGIIDYPKCAFCTCEDNYYNIPQIYHGGENVSKNVNITVNAIRFLVGKLSEKGRNSIYSFSLSWNMDNRLVSVSFMGHVDDLNEWIHSFGDISVDKNGFNEWLEKQVVFIHTHGADSPSPMNSSHIKQDGMLFFQRRAINNDVEIKDIQYDKDTNGIALELMIDEDKPELAELVRNNDLSYTYTSIVNHAICEKTNNDYLDSQLISSIGETTAILDDVRIQGFVWKRQQ